jgi:hypothetical protein
MLQDRVDGRGLSGHEMLERRIRYVLLATYRRRARSANLLSAFHRELR